LQVVGIRLNQKIPGRATSHDHSAGPRSTRLASISYFELIRLANEAQTARLISRWVSRTAGQTCLHSGRAPPAPLAHRIQCVALARGRSTKVFRGHTRTWLGDKSTPVGSALPPSGVAGNTGMGPVVFRCGRPPNAHLVFLSPTVAVCKGDSPTPDRRVSNVFFP